MNIIDAHWTIGGTALTNFDFEDLPQYKKAIEKHGDKNFVVSMKPFSPYTFKGCSLHCLNIQETRDASSFWETFRTV